MDGASERIERTKWGYRRNEMQREKARKGGGRSRRTLGKMRTFEPLAQSSMVQYKVVIGNAVTASRMRLSFHDVSRIGSQRCNRND